MPSSSEHPPGDASPAAAPTRAQAPLGVNHLVLTVSDIEASHRFYTELLGFSHTATSSGQRADGLPPMRFYSGRRDGQLTHHDLALYQLSSLSQAPGQRLDHLAIDYPDEASWRSQIAFLQSRGVPLHRMIERGATWSIHVEDPDGLEIELVFDRPRDQWAHDIPSAINRRKHHETW